MENNISTKIQVTDSSANIRIGIADGENFMSTTMAAHGSQAVIFMHNLEEIEQFARNILHQVLDTRIAAENKR